MKATTFKKCLKFVGDKAIEYAPEILAVTAAAGVVATIIAAVKATKKTCDDMRVDEENGELPEKKIDKVKRYGKNFIPVAVGALVTGAALFGSISSNYKRKTILAATLAMTENAFDDYKDKAKELFGQKKVDEIENSITKDKIKKNPPTSSSIIVTGGGDSLCMDDYTERYFTSSYDKIMDARNRFNDYLLRNDKASLNDLYDILGVKHSKIGNSVGWDISDGLLEISVKAMVSEDHRPCLVMRYDRSPKKNFWRYG